MNIKQVKGWWNQLTPRKKKNLSIAALITVILIGSLIAYEMRGGRHTNTKPFTKKEIGLDTDMLEKSAYLEGQKNFLGLKGDIEEMRKDMKNLEKIKDRKGAIVSSTPYPKPPSEKAKYPPATATQPQTTLRNQGLAKTEAPGLIIGEIGMAKNDDISKSNETEKKKVGSQIYLPPSFMEATLLSGLDAPTTTGGKGNPVPVLLRIKDLAFLPNRVKANLKGCFVIAEGYGDLADERAHLRLVTLSCLSKKGKAVIDAKIKGFVVDTDGKIGLRGRVVSKMGATIARSMLAGFFGGLGEAITDQTEDVAISPLGQTKSYNSSRVFEAGIGKGISSGAKELQKFYLDLARQTMPVIEVGATRAITLVVSEGTELKIKEL